MLDPGRVMEDALRGQVEALYRLREACPARCPGVAVRAAGRVSAAVQGVHRALVLVGLWAETGGEQILNEQLEVMVRAIRTVAEEIGVTPERLEAELAAHSEIRDRAPVAALVPKSAGG